MSQQNLLKQDNYSNVDIRQQAPELFERVNDSLKEAMRLGADGAEVLISAGVGFELEVRQEELDKIQFNRDQSFGITLYRGQAKGSASTTETSLEAIRETVAAAWHITRHTMEDPYAGLADADQMATEVADLDLYHPWSLDFEEAKRIALETEAAAKAVDSRITNSGGATVSTGQGCYVYGNTHGFAAAVPSAQHSLSCAVIASAPDEMQQDYWYSVARQAADLESAQSIGRKAGERTVARLGGRPVATGARPVVLAAWVAAGFVGHLVAAMAGGNIYRKSSFLVDSLGQQILPERYSLWEQPYQLKGLGSAAFDGDGLATRDQSFIVDGVLDQYVLSTLSARHLNLKSTANAGGVHNLRLTHDDLALADVLAEMKEGVYITELLGPGINLVTGDYSRGASGFLVESGKITRPIREITIAGNLRDLFANVRAVGSDLETRGNLLIGSMLIDGFTIAGA